MPASPSCGPQYSAVFLAKMNWAKLVLCHHDFHNGDFDFSDYTLDCPHQDSTEPIARMFVRGIPL